MKLPRISVLLFCACTFTGGMTAQQPEVAVPEQGPHAIHLNVVVAPRKGDNPVAGLPQSAFTVLDNGKPQPIQSFRAIAGSAPSTQVMMIIDAVNVPYVQLAYEREQVDKFLRANDGKLAQPIALGLFTDTTAEMTGFTSDGNGLSKTLAAKEIGLRDLRRSAGFYGAEERLDISLKGMQQFVARARALPGRKVIIWVSPGWPLLSGPGVQLTGRQQDSLYHQIIAISKLIREANVTIYAVNPLGAQQNPQWTFYYESFLKGVQKPSQVDPGDLGLQVLAVQSGGLVLNSSNDVAGLLQRCMDDLKAYYEITYAPPPADAPDQFHKVQVSVSVSDATARTINGYYSQP